MKNKSLIKEQPSSPLGPMIPVAPSAPLGAPTPVAPSAPLGKMVPAKPSSETKKYFPTWLLKRPTFRRFYKNLQNAISNRGPLLYAEWDRPLEAGKNVTYHFDDGTDLTIAWPSGWGGATRQEGLGNDLVTALRAAHTLSGQPLASKARKFKKAGRLRYNKDVEEVQKAFHKYYGGEKASKYLGYRTNPTGIDGKLGSRTKSLIKKFKKDHEGEPESFAALAKFIRGAATSKATEVAPTASAPRTAAAGPFDPAQKYAATAQRAALSRRQQTEPSPGPDVAETKPSLTRPQAINTARKMLAPYYARVTAGALAANVVKYLIDKKGLQPYDAYDKTRAVFGSRDDSQWGTPAFKQNLENLLGLTYSEINKLSESNQKSKLESMIFESTKMRNENLFKELIQNVIK